MMPGVKRVPILDRWAELLAVTSFNFHFAVLVSPPVVFGPDSGRVADAAAILPLKLVT